MKLLSAQIPLWNRKVKKLIPIQSVSQCSSVRFPFTFTSKALQSVDFPRLQKSNHMNERERERIVGPRVDRYCYTSRHSSTVPGAGGYSVRKTELFVLPVTICETRRPSSAAIKGVPVGHGSRVSLYYY